MTGDAAADCPNSDCLEDKVESGWCALFTTLVAPQLCCVDVQASPTPPRFKLMYLSLCSEGLHAEETRLDGVRKRKVL